MKIVRYGTIILLIAFLNSACSDNSTGTKDANKDTGTLKVTITTEGPDANDYDSDGYKLTLENHSQEIGIQDNILIDDLSIGNHEVKLTGLADNCKITNKIPIEVNISSKGTTSLDLNVKCFGVLKNKIIYLSYISDKPLPINKSKIASINPDGSNKKIIRNILERYEDLVFSPNGTKIAYSDVDGGIRIISSEGNGYAYRFGGQDTYGPELSPDGETLVYTDGIGYDSRTYLLNLNKGWPPKSLPVGRDYHMQITPTFSPSGKEVAYAGQAVGQDPNEFNIFLQTIDDSAPTKLTQNGNNRNPAFAKDGTHIIYQSTKRSNGEEYTNIEMVNNETKKITELTSGIKFDGFSPVVSHDGSKVIFLRFKNSTSRSSEGAIYLIDLKQNNELIKLTEFTKDITRLGNFSPNGNYVVFTKENQIYKVDTKGNMNVVQLTNNSFPNTNPRWSPVK